MKKIIIATAIVFSASIASSFAATTGSKNNSVITNEKDNLATADRGEKDNLATADRNEKDNLATADRKGEKDNLATADRNEKDNLATADRF